MCYLTHAHDKISSKLKILKYVTIGTQFFVLHTVCICGLQRKSKTEKFIRYEYLMTSEMFPHGVDGFR